MRKRKRLALAALALCLFLAGCQYQPMPTSGQRTQEPQSPYAGNMEESYYMVAFLKGLDYWKYCYEGFENSAQAHGVRCYYKGEDSSNIEQNISVLEGIIAKSPSGIAISCVAPEPYEEIIRQAMAAGIQVVTYDSDSEHSGRTCFIGTGNVDAGEGAGLRVLSKRAGANIMLVYSDGLECSMNRITGFEKAIGGQPGYAIAARVDDRGDLGVGIRATKEQLQNHPQVNVVFCASGIASASAITAIKELDRKDVMLITWDVNKIVLDAIEEGVVESTIAQGMYSMGYWAMEVLYASRHQLTQNNFPSFIDTGYEFITKETIEKFR